MGGVIELHPHHQAELIVGEQCRFSMDYVGDVIVQHSLSRTEQLWKLYWAALRHRGHSCTGLPHHSFPRPPHLLDSQDPDVA